MRLCRGFRRRAAAGWLGARLGLFAILFQAILFGWHHHDLVFAGSQHLPPVIGNQSTATQPVDDEDGCEICQVIHHQTAATGNGIIAPLPGLTASPSIAADPVFVVRSLALAFRARAPPLA
jgi:hypothetical protein